MIELGELESRHEDFARRNVRIIAVSVEGTGDAFKTQRQFPHLTVVADEGHGLSDAVDVIHPDSNPSGGDTSAPTTIVSDRHGTVRWLYRSNAVNVRLSPDEVLEAVDRALTPTAVK
jgi:peroxiredoxin